MEIAIAELLKKHPNLDRMMCETLFTLHAQGKLEQFHERLDRDAAVNEQSTRPHSIIDGVIVEHPTAVPK